MYIANYNFYCLGFILNCSNKQKTEPAIVDFSCCVITLSPYYYYFTTGFVNYFLARLHSFILFCFFNLRILIDCDATSTSARQM